LKDDVRKSTKRAIKVNAIFGAIALAATFLFCVGVMSSVEQVLIPINIAPLKLFGHAAARFNRIELGEKPGGILDLRPLEMDAAVPCMLSYELGVRKMGQLTMSAVFADGRTRLLARLDASDFWPNAGLIVDGKPITLTVYIGRHGQVSVNIDSESRVILEDVLPAPFGLKIEFLGGDIAVFDASLVDADISVDFMDERGRILHRLRHEGEKSPYEFARFFFLNLMLIIIFIFRAIDLRFKRFDAASYIVLFGGVALAATTRQYAPAPFAIALMTAVFIKIAFVMSEKSHIKLYVLFPLLPVALSAFVVLGGYAPVSTIPATFAAALMLLLQKTIRGRKQIKASQARSIIILLAIVLCMEGAVRLHFPSGRILRGISEDIFWSMFTKETPAFQKIGRDIICQGKLLDDKPRRDRPAVVLLGGSVIFGSEVDPKMNLTNLIQESIGERAEIYNAGLAGLTSFEILENFNRHLAQKKPEIVLVYLLHNDIFQAGPLTRRQIHERRRPSREIRGWLAHSFLYRYLAEKTARWKDKAGAGRCSDAAIIDSFKKNLDELAEAIAKADGKPIFVPEEVRLLENSQELVDELRQCVLDMGKRQGISAGAVFIPEYEPRGEINFTDNCHLTRTGYHRLADGLTKMIDEALDDLSPTN
jgi:lysophospholipase L1-like esterase